MPLVGYKQRLGKRKSTLEHWTQLAAGKFYHLTCLDAVCLLLYCTPASSVPEGRLSVAVHSFHETQAQSQHT